MLPPKLRARSKIRLCHHCANEINGTKVTITYESKEESEKLAFCCSDCLVEHLYDSDINARVNRAVRTELNWIHKQVYGCERCRRKIQTAI